MSDRADVAIVKYLNEHGYHPRSSKHGDALCEFLLRDLLRSCPVFRNAADRNAIVFQRNYTIAPQAPDQWNADLVVGPPREPVNSNSPRVGEIAQGDPSAIWMAIDTKTIMTEHGKARRNRQRDLNSFHDILHRKNAKTIVGGLLLVNLADRFQTPLARTSGGVTPHPHIERLVAEIVSLIDVLPRAAPAPGRAGIEALGIIVVKHTNVKGDVSEIVTAPPARSAGQPLSYLSFLHDLCEAFGTRFAG
jgi:hypothetical protein